MVRAIKGLAILIAAVAAYNLPPLPGHRVLFLGDSITAQWDVRLYFPYLTTFNRGVDGWTSAQILGITPEALLFHPDVVVVEMGVNDMRADNASAFSVVENIVQVVRLSRQNGSRVIVLDVPSTYGAARTKHTGPVTILRLNRVLQSLADIEGYTFVPVFESFTEASTRDGLHPNAAGYGLLRDALQGELWTN